jgi:hypothetical protein
LMWKTVGAADSASARNPRSCNRENGGATMQLP